MLNQGVYRKLLAQFGPRYAELQKRDVDFSDAKVQKLLYNEIETEVMLLKGSTTLTKGEVEACERVFKEMQNAVINL